MKKIDFHIHTISTPADPAFEFDIRKLQEYVNTMGIDGIAITNHNVFDLTQFQQISQELGIAVLPGIEINLGSGHCLVIADLSDIDSFVTKCNKVTEIADSGADSIDVAELREIFGDLSKYLVIPHYDKHKAVDKNSLDLLGADFIVGEVASAKKFIYAIKDAESKTPVLFSDSRSKADWQFKTRQTYIDVSSIDIRSIRLCLVDKSKVALSEEEGKELIQVTPEGVKISNSLTVILGGRSSGKSYTLDQIASYNDNVKYIRQFELIEDEPDKEEEKFNQFLGQRQREDRDAYLGQFRSVVEDVKNISLRSDDIKLDEYLVSLLKLASDTERHDEYSKAALFSETEFQTEENEKLKSLIKATQILLEPGIYASIVDAKVSNVVLRELLIELIDKFREEVLARDKREWVNSLVRAVKQELGSRSAVSPVKEIDLLALARNKQKVEMFEEIVKELQKPRTITRKPIYRLTIEVQSAPISGAKDMKDISRSRAGFADAFSKYNNPYEFLLALKQIEDLDATTYHLYFTKIEYKILNEYGANISGGERAEFKLIHKIDDALSYDMLLIDEPESSFDNVFLSDDVNRVIKDIAKSMPVVVVTHNNTIGASIKPDYLIYTERKVTSGTPQYNLYFGRATDKDLESLQGKKLSNAKVTLRYLEAGEVNYEERRKLYEMLKN